MARRSLIGNSNEERIAETREIIKRAKGGTDDIVKEVVHKFNENKTKLNDAIIKNEQLMVEVDTLNNELLSKGLIIEKLEKDLSELREEELADEDPVLAMISDDGEMEFQKKAHAGEIKYNMQSGKKEVLGYLDPKRKIRIHIPKWMKPGEYEGWIKHEREYGCYPTDVINDTEHISSLMTKLQHNYHELDIIDKIAGHINIKLFRNVILVAIIAVMVMAIVYIAWPNISDAIGQSGVDIVGG